MVGRATSGLLVALAIATAIAGILALLLSRSPGVEAPARQETGGSAARADAPLALDSGTGADPAERREAARPETAGAPPPRLSLEVLSEGTVAPARPLPGATLTAEGFGPPLGTTDRAGRIELALPRGTEGLRLRAEARGHAPANRTVFVEDGLARARMTLAQVAVLVGRVRHADGRPAADVRVAAFGAEEARGLEAPAGPRRQGPGTPSTSTDEQGRYEIELRAGSWRLAASSLLGVDEPWGWTDPTEAVEGAETRVEDLVLPAVPTARLLRGRVLDFRGEPVAGAGVRYDLVAKGVGSLGSLRADGEGRFAIFGRAGDRYEVVAGASAPGLRAARAEGVVGGDELDLVLEVAPVLDVVVRAPDGPPDRELRWWIGRVGEDGEPEPIAYGACLAAERGVFSTTWPEGGAVLQILGEPEPVTLPAPPPHGGRARVEVRLRGELRVSGRVLGAALGLAHPLVRARNVTADGLSDDPDSWPRRGTLAARAADDGSFRLRLQEPGTYLIGVTCDLRAPLVIGPIEVLAPPGVVGLELALERAGPAAEDEE